LREELRNKRSQLQVAEERRNERLRQSQEAQRQEITSLKSLVSQQNTLAKAQYAEQMQKREKEMELELRQKSDAMRQELLMELQRKEDAMRQSFDVQLAKAQVRENIQ
jgi:hypothetical protein